MPSKLTVTANLGVLSMDNRGLHDHVDSQRLPRYEKFLKQNRPEQHSAEPNSILNLIKEEKTSSLPPNRMVSSQSSTDKPINRKDCSALHTGSELNVPTKPVPCNPIQLPDTNSNSRPNYLMGPVLVTESSNSQPINTYTPNTNLTSHHASSSTASDNTESSFGPGFIKNIF